MGVALAFMVLGITAAGDAVKRGEIQRSTTSWTATAGTIVSRADPGFE